jgi:hypothetical protein
VFINLTDERYTKFVPAHQPGSSLSLQLVGINDLHETVKGTVSLRLFDAKGKSTWQKDIPADLLSYERTPISLSLPLPRKAGGYTLVSEWTPANGKAKVISRRYLRVGKAGDYHYFEPRF